MRKIIVIIGLLFVLKSTAQHYKPDFVLKPDRYTNLLVFDGNRSPGIFPILDSPSFRHIKFWAENWNSPAQWVSWDVTSTADELYLVNVLCNSLQSGIVQFEVQSGGQLVTGNTMIADTAEFNRIQLDGLLLLHKGSNKLTLKIRPLNGNDSFNVSVHGIELVRPSVKREYDELTKNFREQADTRWFRECRYGLFITWTSQVFPRNGERKNYNTAVGDFDVDGFVNQVVKTGAGLVVFNTSHAEMYFPAPLRSLDSILPGRTTKRDLIAELSHALALHGIKLFLYYHLGCVSDSVWTKTCGFWETDDSRFFSNWKSVIREVGNRYGPAVSGYWFDDGSMNYYYRSPDWLELYKATKAGNPQRLVGYNTWKLPPATQFMDYYLGETNLDPSMHGQLKKGGDGIILTGPYKGLQASSTFVTESEEWGHFSKNKEIIPFRYSDSQLASILREFESYGNVPLINLEIYQTGLMSENSISVFERARLTNEKLKNRLTHEK
jgi:hypothetical protein